MQQPLEEQQTLAEEPAPVGSASAQPEGPGAARGPGLAATAGMVVSAGVGAGSGAVAGAAGAALVLDQRDDDDAAMADLLAQLQAQQQALQAAQTAPAPQAFQEDAAADDAGVDDSQSVSEPLRAATQLDVTPSEPTVAQALPDDETAPLSEPVEDVLRPAGETASAATFEEDASPNHVHHEAGVGDSEPEAAAPGDASQAGDSEEDGGGGLEDGFEDSDAIDVEGDGAFGPSIPLGVNEDAPPAPAPTGEGGELPPDAPQPEQPSDPQAGNTDQSDDEQPSAAGDGEQSGSEPHDEHAGHADPEQHAGDEHEQPAEAPVDEAPEAQPEDPAEPVVLPEPVTAAGQAPAIVEFTANGVVVQNLDGSLHGFDQDEGHFLIKPDGSREQVPGSPLQLVSFDPANGNAVIDNIYDEQPPFVLNQAGQLTFLPAADGNSVTGLDLIGSNALRGWTRIATPDGQVYELRPNGEIYRINEYGFQVPFEGHIPGHLHLKTIQDDGLVQVEYQGSVINLHPDGSTAFVSLAPEAMSSYGVADDFSAAAEPAAADDAPLVEEQPQADPPADESSAEEPVDEDAGGGGGQDEEPPAAGETPTPSEEEPVTPPDPEPVEEPGPADEAPENGEGFEAADDVPDDGADELKFETLTFVEEPVVELQPPAEPAVEAPAPASADFSFVEGSGLADLNLSFANLDVFELDDDLEAAELD